MRCDGDGIRAGIGRAGLARAGEIRWVRVSPFCRPVVVNSLPAKVKAVPLGLGLIVGDHRRCSAVHSQRAGYVAEIVVVQVGRAHRVLYR